VRARRRIRFWLPVAAGLAAVVFFLASGEDREAPEHAPTESEETAAPQGEGVRPLRIARAKSQRAGSGSTSERPHEEDRDATESAAFAAGRRTNRAEKERGRTTDPLGTRRAEPIILDRLVLATDAPTVQIAGFDPRAPRKLAAWRIKGDRQAVIAWGESDRDGNLLFPLVVAPGEGLEVVITDADSSPASPGTSAARRLAARLPEAPTATLLEAVEDEVFLRIAPIEANGEVLLADAGGAIFARYEVPPTPAAAARVFDVAVTLYGGDDRVLMAHEFSDGRRSDWRVLPLGTPVDGE
jgi:hypothetical protein